MKTLYTTVAASLLLLPSAALAVTFNEITRVNVDTTSNVDNDEYIGSNPSAVAWDGSQLFVAGFNSTGVSVGPQATTAIVEVTNATTLGNVDATYDATNLGEQIATPLFRGYASLDLSADGTTLAAAYDFGVPITGGIAAFNTSDNSLRWQINERGSSGVAFDPGFNGGNDQGVAFGAFGSGRRALHDTTTGNVIHGLGTTTFIWYGGVGDTQTRDLDFDPSTGDVYARASNDLHAGTRNGADTTDSPARIIDNGSNGNGINGHNLSFMGTTSDGNLVIYNDRTITGLGQTFDSVVNVIDTSGNAVASTFNFLGGSIPDGNGYYDFDFDPVSQTLALMDFANRNVHIFSVGGAGLGGDFDNDTDVDVADALLGQRLGESLGTGSDWETNFGAGGVPASAVTAVPEPTSLLLAGFGLLALGRRRR